MKTKAKSKAKKLTRKEIIDELGYLLGFYGDKKTSSKLLKDVSVANLLELKERIEQYGQERHDLGWDNGYDAGYDNGYNVGLSMG